MNIFHGTGASYSIGATRRLRCLISREAEACDDNSCGELVQVGPGDLGRTHPVCSSYNLTRTLSMFLPAVLRFCGTYPCLSQPHGRPLQPAVWLELVALSYITDDPSAECNSFSSYRFDHAHGPLLLHCHARGPVGDCMILCIRLGLVLPAPLCS